MRWRPTVATVLLSVLAILAPLAYATPPDCTWLSGWWDDADHDDVIFRVTSDVGAIGPHPALERGPIHTIVMALPQGGERPARIGARSSPPSRAPPAP